ncbi:MAG: GDSL-type esterase/lipase family protein [Treponema sp.]|jgi:lysophospholipase L1-like esterase|nr:GDSL-type esterase/lipase family protein [Treponema sp.]
MKKRMKIFLTVLISIACFFMILLPCLGWFFFGGPFRDLSITRIRRQYRNRPPGEIIFYGASNFTFWRTLEKDMAPYAVQNHGFGGSTDNDLMKYAEKALYDFEPKVVVFQSGSNDFVIGMSPDEIMANKDKMFSLFRERLPNATFIVLSMLPLPGRSIYWPDSKQVNAFLAEYCAAHTMMIFVDASEAMMTAGGDFRPELYTGDGIHLNPYGRNVWGPLIKTVFDGMALRGLIPF